MITKRLAEMLTAQIASELSAHMIYQAVSIYFRRQSLQRWGKLYFDQGVEEATHANKIMDFLIDQDVSFELPKLPGAKTEFKTPLDAVRTTLSNEQKVSGQFQAMAKAALEEGDHTASSSCSGSSRSRSRRSGPRRRSWTSSRAGSTSSRPSRCSSRTRSATRRCAQALITETMICSSFSRA